MSGSKPGDWHDAWDDESLTAGNTRDNTVAAGYKLHDRQKFARYYQIPRRENYWHPNFPFLSSFQSAISAVFSAHFFHPANEFCGVYSNDRCGKTLWSKTYTETAFLPYAFECGGSIHLSG